MLSLLWANTSYPAKYISLRCNRQNPAVDSNSRLVDESCRDTNPGTWHLAIINQIGVQKEPLIMDIAYHQEVWNQPIYSYKYWYFNPKILTTTYRLEEAMVSVEQFPQDRFKSLRAVNTKYIVGIGMQVTYVATAPYTHKDIHYLYDLELDADKNIIGGEWRSLPHPDFLWRPESNADAQSVGDFALKNNYDKWDMRYAVPLSWRKAALLSSVKRQPLAKILKVLLEASNSDAAFVSP